MIIDEGDKSVMLGRLREQLAARYKKRIEQLEADNTRLREALEKTKASLLKYLRNTDAIIYTEAAALVLEIDRALAPQPAKEGE